MRTMILLAGLSLSLAGPAAAQIYRCDGPKGPVFSQTPCAPDAEEVHVRTIAADPETAEEARRRTEAADERHALHLQRARHDVRLRQARDELASVIARRDRELADVQRRRGHALNNLAGATYLQALAGEEQAASMRYASRIQSLSNEIAELERTRP